MNIQIGGLSIPERDILSIQVSGNKASVVFMTRKLPHDFPYEFRTDEEREDVLEWICYRNMEKGIKERFKYSKDKIQE